ncbi:MAG: ABC transporter ATP-binding protein [Planctomycetota bacterium]|nr:MAG: ABC transporter ATP-binding protein [Planctomycetota bacterium]
MARLQVEGLHKAYPGLPVLVDCHLEVAAAEAVAIQGASGTGKSTLLNCIGLLDSPDSGRISLDGQDVNTCSRRERSALRGRRLGFVFQAFHLLPEFNVLENILLAARCAHLPVSAWRARAESLLQRLGLADRALSDVSTLSGGERQRVALCRALLLKPALILADEPTGNLDPDTAALVLDHLLELVHSEGSSLVLVTHDSDIAHRCDRQLRLQQGQLNVGSRPTAGSRAGASVAAPAP